MTSEWVKFLLGGTVTIIIGVIGWMAQEIVKLKSKVAVNEQQLALIPLADMIKEQLLHALHHDRTEFSRADELIEKALACTITVEESSELDAFLAHRMIDPTVNEEERIQAELLRVAIKLIEHRKLGLVIKATNAILPTIPIVDN